MRTKEELILKLYMDTKEAENSLKKLKRELRKVQTEPMTEKKLIKAIEVYNRGVEPIRNLQKQAKRLQDYGVKNKFVDSLAELNTSLKVSERTGKVVTNSLTRQLNRVRESMTLLDRVSLKAGKSFRSFEFGMFSVMFAGWMFRAVLGGIIRDVVSFYGDIVGGNSRVGLSLMELSAQWNYLRYSVGEAVAGIVVKLKPLIDWFSEFTERHKKFVGAVIVGVYSLATLGYVAGGVYMGIKALAGGILGLVNVIEMVSLHPLIAAFVLLAALIGYVIYQAVKYKMTWRGVLKYIANLFIDAFTYISAFIDWVMRKTIVKVQVAVGEGIAKILDVAGLDSWAKKVRDNIAFLKEMSKEPFKVILQEHRESLREAVNKASFGIINLTMGRESFKEEESWRRFYEGHKGYVSPAPVVNKKEINININNPQLLNHDQIEDLTHTISQRIEEEMKFNY